jgi:hypothetical protein
MLGQAFGKSKHAETENGDTCDEQRLIVFFDIKGIVHEQIRPGRPNSQFSILL